MAARLTLVTELLYLRDAELRVFDAAVVDAGEAGVVLDRTTFYVTGGGQPHDTGTLTWDGGSARVVDVRKVDGEVMHVLEGDQPLVGATVTGEIDWDRRFSLMRTHTALHVLCGVIWNEHATAVTGGNMEPLSARMDFEFDPVPAGFGETIERRLSTGVQPRRACATSPSRSSAPLAHRCRTARRP